MSLQEIEAFESALGQEGVDMLSATLDTYNDPQALGRQLAKTYGHTHLGGVVAYNSDYSVLLDPTGTSESWFFPRNAYLRGGLYGVHVAYNFLNAHSIEQVCGVDPVVVMANESGRFPGIPTVVFDTISPEEKVALALVDAGHRGWQESPEYHDLINDWIGGISPEKQFQDFVRVGLGAVLASMRGAYSHAKMADVVEMDMELEWAHAVDYNVEFRPE